MKLKCTFPDGGGGIFTVSSSSTLNSSSTLLESVEKSLQFLDAAALLLTHENQQMLQ